MTTLVLSKRESKAIQEAVEHYMKEGHILDNEKMRTLRSVLNYMGKDVKIND